MDYSNQEIKPHPQLLDMLFACKRKVSSVFHDVLGIHEISHMAVSYVNDQQELLTFSSTPALEFNLFNSPLWTFDQTYQFHWIQQGTQAFWQKLYCPARYDELYYLKQLKHHYPTGISLAAKLGKNYVIYSIASRENNEYVQELFSQQHENFYRIGQYCTQHLLPLFAHYDHTVAHILHEQEPYEASK